MNLRTVHIHQLTLYQFPPREPLPLLLALSSAGKLRRGHTASPYSWLAPFLSTICSRELVELVFHTWLSSESELDMVDWPAICSVFANADFSAMQRVHFQVLGMGEGREDVKRWLLSRLAPWTSAGRLLQVSFMEW